MVRDAVAFDMIETEVTNGVAYGGVAVGEAMQTMLAIVPIMPIVKEVVVQQRGTDERMQLDPVPQVQPVRHPHGEAGYAYRMRERGHHAVLIAALFDLHMLMFENLPAVSVDQPLDLYASQHYFSKDSGVL